MHQKVDGEVVFCMCADFLCTDGLQACECLRRGPIILRRSLSGRSCGQPAVITVRDRIMRSFTRRSTSRFTASH